MKRAALDKKDMLNPKEASIYFGIPEMKLRAYLKARPNLECISYFGSRILIDRYRHADLGVMRPDDLRP